MIAELLFYEWEKFHLFVVVICLSLIVLRTLTGHKSSAKSVDFHPFGDYVTSGSLDTNIKVMVA